jgi:hypothetical protein
LFDLHRDGRHSFPAETNEDAFYIPALPSSSTLPGLERSGSNDSEGNLVVHRVAVDITVNVDLREVIRSIELHPETL